MHLDVKTLRAKILQMTIQLTAGHDLTIGPSETRNTNTIQRILISMCSFTRRDTPAASSKREASINFHHPL